MRIRIRKELAQGDGRRYRTILMLLLSLALASCSTQGIEERFHAGMQLLYENRYEDAESFFLTLARELEHNPTDSESSWRAKALYQAARIDQLYLNLHVRAISNYRESLKADPQGPFSFRAHRAIAMIYQDRLANYRSAVEEFEQLVQLYPQKKGIEQYQYRIAQCYFLLQDLNQARAEVKTLLDKIPTGPVASQAKLLEANSFYLEGRFIEAAQSHEQFLTMSPEPEMAARSLFELGLCYREMGDLERAEKAFLEAIKNHPNPTLVREQVSELHQRRITLDSQVAEVRKSLATPVQKIDAATAAAPVPAASEKPKAVKPQESGTQTDSAPSQKKEEPKISPKPTQTASEPKDVPAKEAKPQDRVEPAPVSTPKESIPKPAPPLVQNPAQPTEPAAEKSK